MLAVSDDGSGIPAAILREVTEPFFNHKAVGKGTGLACRWSTASPPVGRRDLDRSQEGEGTTVEIWLPLAPAPRAPRTTARRSLRGGAEGRPLSILLVDDHERALNHRRHAVRPGHRLRPPATGPGC